MQNHKVLVVGDIMLDHYTYGSCNRISPEAPVPVFEYCHEEKMLGGAGNVVKNLVSLGVECDIISLIGADNAAIEIKYLFDKIGVKSNSLITEDNRPTTIKQRFIASNQQLLRLDVETKDEINDLTEETLLKEFHGKVNDADLVILSDYLKGMLTFNLCQNIISHCKSIGKRVLIDPKGNDYSKYKGAFLVKPNLKEFNQITNKIHSLEVDIEMSARNLKELLEIETLVVTLGEKGIYALNNESVFSPTIPSEVFDVSGAGDTVLACLSYGILADYNLDLLCKFANGGASIVISKFGSHTATIEEIKDKIKE
ncbi:MAG: hypothetical protein RLY43_625 [Bacteroidota bacterium]|jgi:D-beta-D-heptose 7-phosphate kinase/D-beta-D-heptose 1-phosphate adenosyltransferase